MRALLATDTFAAERPVVPPDVRYVVDAGWTVGPNGALLLAALWREGMHDIPAAALGHGEYEVNDVDVSLGDLGRDRPEFLPRAAARVLLVARRLLTGSRGLPGADTLLATVSISVDVDDEDFALQGGTVRFFTRRGEHPGWFDELEGFTREAIAVLDAVDAPDDQHNPWGRER